MGSDATSSTELMLMERIKSLFVWENQPMPPFGSTWSFNLLEKLDENIFFSMIEGILQKANCGGWFDYII